MSTFVMLTRVAPGAARSPAMLQILESTAMDAVRANCPEVEWQQSFALIGPYDYLDIFDAPSIDDAVRVSTLIRTLGHSRVQVLPATEWQMFKACLSDLNERTSQLGNGQAAADEEDVEDEMLTQQDILANVKDLDDASIAAILALEPTYAEFEAALTWAAGMGDTMGDGEDSRLSPKAARILEILAPLTDEAEEEARPA